MTIDGVSWKARELDILGLMARGLTDAEIGGRLHLSHQTIRWYNKQIFAKLEVTNRTQAVRRAIALGLLQEQAPPPPSAPQASRPPVQFIANEGVHLAYTITGSGPVDLLFIHGFLSHMELAWEEPEYARFFDQLGRHARVILFDKRGMGLSDRIQGASTLENTISDARAVLDAVRSKKAFIMGTSESGAAAILLASTVPERVRGLILYAATPKLVSDAGGPAWALSSEGMERFIESLQQTWGEPLALEHFAPSRVNDAEFRAWWARVLRSASSPSSIHAVLSMLTEIDIRDLLPQVRLRTLVAHKSGDRMVSVEAGRYLADHIPGAQWVELPGEDHIYFVESEGLLSAVIRFIEEPESQTVDTRIALVLAAQGSPDHRRSAAGILREFRPLSTGTDGELLATFDSPTRAVKCARRLSEAGLGAGLHVGECRVTDGRPVDHVAAQAREVAELAAPGEVRVTRGLRDILGGMGLTFRPDSATSTAAADRAPLTLV